MYNLKITHLEPGGSGAGAGKKLSICLRGILLKILFIIMSICTHALSLIFQF